MFVTPLHFEGFVINQARDRNVLQVAHVLQNSFLTNSFVVFTLHHLIKRLPVPPSHPPELSTPGKVPSDPTATAEPRHLPPAPAHGAGEASQEAALPRDDA